MRGPWPTGRGALYHMTKGGFARDCYLVSRISLVKNNLKMEKEALLSDKETSGCINDRQVNVKRVSLGAWLFGYFPIVKLYPKIRLVLHLVYIYYNQTPPKFIIILWSF